MRSRALLRRRDMENDNTGPLRIYFDMGQRHAFPLLPKSPSPQKVQTPAWLKPVLFHLDRRNGLNSFDHIVRGHTLLDYVFGTHRVIACDSPTLDLWSPYAHLRHQHKITISLIHVALPSPNCATYPKGASRNFIHRGRRRVFLVLSESRLRCLQAVALSPVEGMYHAFHGTGRKPSPNSVLLQEGSVHGLAWGVYDS